MKALHIHTDGLVHEVEIPEGYPDHLDALQRLVGGYIEYVPTEQDVTLYCNEEGKVKNLLPNPVATAAFGQLIQPHDYFAGDVVVVGPINSAGNDTTLDVEAWLSYVKEWTI